MSTEPLSNNFYYFKPCELIAANPILAKKIFAIASIALLAAAATLYYFRSHPNSLE